MDDQQYVLKFDHSLSGARAAIIAVHDWGRDHGYYNDDTRVAVYGVSSDEMPRRLTFTHQPQHRPGDLPPARLDVDVPVASSLRAIGYLYGGGHVASVVGQAWEMVNRLEISTNVDGSFLLTGHEAWAWMCHPRAVLEYALPVQLMTAEQATNIEHMQFVALRARIRTAAHVRTRYVYDSFLEYYGEHSMTIRRLRSCLYFCSSLELMRNRSLLYERQRVGAVQRDEDPAARARLINAFFYIAELGAADVAAGRQTAAAEFYHTSVSGNLLRALERYTAIIDDLQKHDSDPADSSSGLSPDSDDELDETDLPRLTERQRARPGESASIAECRLIRRRLDRFEQIRRRTHLAKCKSAAMLLAFGSTRSWRHQVQDRLPAGPGSAFLDAFILGYAWACPLGHIVNGPPRTCICGRHPGASSDNELDVHFLFDTTCSVASVFRLDHARKVTAIFRRVNLSYALDAALAHLGVRARAAFVLGSPRRWPPLVADHIPTKTGRTDLRGQCRALPVEVQLDLALAFVNSFGAWSTQARKHFPWCFPPS